MRKASTATKAKSTSVPLLHAEVSGSGPTLVLLHGFLLSSRYWQELAEILASHYRVIALDLLGFGQSPKPRRSTYDYDAQMQSINATLTHLGVNQPFTMIGHSMGALLALRYARTFPANVSSLMLANMPVTLTPAEARREFMGTSLIYRLGLTPYTQRLIWPVFRTIVASRLLPRMVVQELSDRAAYMFQHTARSRLRSFRSIIVNASVEADLQALKVRTVLLTGLSDRLIYLENLRQLMLQSNISSEIVEGAHHLAKTRPDLFVRLIREVSTA